MHHLCLTERFRFTDVSLCPALPGEPRDGITDCHPSLPPHRASSTGRRKGSGHWECMSREAVIQSYTWKKGIESHRNSEKLLQFLVLSALKVHLRVLYSWVLALWKSMFQRIGSQPFSKFRSFDVHENGHQYFEAFKVPSYFWKKIIKTLSPCIHT